MGFCYKIRVFIKIPLVVDYGSKVGSEEIEGIWELLDRGKNHRFQGQRFSENKKMLEYQVNCAGKIKRDSLEVCLKLRF